MIDDSFSLIKTLILLSSSASRPTCTSSFISALQLEGKAAMEYKKEQGLALLLIFALAALSLASLLVAFSYYCYISRQVAKRLDSLKKEGKSEKREKAAPLDNPGIEGGGKEAGGATGMPVVVIERGVQVFTFKQLHSATSRFAKGNVVGHGSSGAVYKGLLVDGRKVAVKLMGRPGKQGEDEFKMEVELMTRLRSPYLLTLLGHCSDGGHRLLVCEFMANGGLHDHLYPAGGFHGEAAQLNWETRMRIALEAAKGLEYLHEHVNPPVIHRGFKSSNILLDNDFHVKISDFCLAKFGSEKVGGHVSTRVLGTQGYVAPEYALTGCLTTKSDVYSYGVVLLELLTGRVPVDTSRHSEEVVLVSWALPRLTDREKVAHILDPALEGQYSIKDAVQIAAIAAMCVQPEADYRPLMADVVQSLVPLVKNRLSWNCSASSHDLRSPIKP